MCSGLFTLRGPDAGMHVPQIVLRLPPTDKGPVAGDTFLGIPTERFRYRMDVASYAYVLFTRHAILPNEVY